MRERARGVSFVLKRARKRSPVRNWRTSKREETSSDGQKIIAFVFLSCASIIPGIDLRSKTSLSALANLIAGFVRRMPRA